MPIDVLRPIRLAPLAAAAIWLACSGETIVTPPPPPGPPGDTLPPVIAVVSPTGASYDEDGDKLVDFRIGISDSGGLVDPSSITVRALDGVSGPADGSANMLGPWPVELQDTSQLVFHETLENLLHGGDNQVEISVSDTAGNVARDTITFTLPHGVLLKTLSTGRTLGYTPAMGVTICPDDHTLYMTAANHLLIADADSLTIDSVVAPNGGDVGVGEMSFPLCIAGDPILWVTDRVQRFDRNTKHWLSRVSGCYNSSGIVQSRRDPNLLYVGEVRSGQIGVIDRAQNLRLHGLLPFAPWDELITALAVLPDDSKLYMNRIVQGGILVIDPLADSVITLISVNPPSVGIASGMALSADDQRLYVAVQVGLRGVVEISTTTDSIVRTLPLPYTAIDLALSPDETRMFVTTQDRGEPSKNVLIDLPGWRVLQEFDRPRAPGAVRFDRDIVFHPNGRYIFVTHDMDLDVYINRG